MFVLSFVMNFKACCGLEGLCRSVCLLLLRYVFVCVCVHVLFSCVVCMTCSFGLFGEKCLALCERLNTRADLVALSALFGCFVCFCGLA